MTTMSTPISTEAHVGTTATALGPARLFAGVGDAAPSDHGHHLRTHGELLLAGHRELVDATAAVGLRGRGGAAFPVTDKLAGTPLGSATEVVVNLSEGEPASHKDRTLATLAPHLILDGALATARALRTRHVTLAVHDREAADVLEQALATRPDGADIRVRRSSGGFVAGEVRALLRSMSDGPAVPPGRRVLPTVAGLGGRPTFVSNAETFAHLGLLATHGPDWYGGIGAVGERGTTLLTLIGDVPHPGVVEVPMGTALSRLVGSDGPVLLGGYHGTWVTDVAGLELDRAGLRARGLHLGAGVIARLPQQTCALGEIARVARWLADQSAGQCGPCFFGLPSVADDLAALTAGRLPSGGLDRLRARIGLLPGRGACGHPDGAALFARTALDVHQTEIARHLAHGSCGRDLLGALPIAGVVR